MKMTNAIATAMPSTSIAVYSLFLQRNLKKLFITVVFFLFSFRNCFEFSRKFFYGPFRYNFSEFFQSDSSAILFNNSEKFSLKISYKIYVIKIQNSFLFSIGIRIPNSVRGVNN